MEIRSIWLVAFMYYNLFYIFVCLLLRPSCFVVVNVSTVVNTSDVLSTKIIFYMSHKINNTPFCTRCELTLCMCTLKLLPFNLLDETLIREELFQPSFHGLPKDLNLYTFNKRGFVERIVHVFPNVAKCKCQLHPEQRSKPIILSTVCLRSTMYLGP